MDKNYTFVRCSKLRNVTRLYDFYFRLNGALSQMTEFRDAFKCGKETKMAATTQCDVF